MLSLLKHVPSSLVGVNPSSVLNDHDRTFDSNGKKGQSLLE